MCANQSHSDDDRRCYICDKKGHLARDCRSSTRYSLAFLLFVIFLVIAGDVLDPDLVTEVGEEIAEIEVEARNAEDADLTLGPNLALDLIHPVNAMAKKRENVHIMTIGEVMTAVETVVVAIEIVAEVVTETVGIAEIVGAMIVDIEEAVHPAKRARNVKEAVAVKVPEVKRDLEVVTRALKNLHIQEVIKNSFR